MKQLKTIIPSNSLAFQLWEIKKAKALDEGIQKLKRQAKAGVPGAAAKVTTKRNQGTARSLGLGNTFAAGIQHGSGGKMPVGRRGSMADRLAAKRNKPLARLKRKVGDVGAAANAKFKIGSDKAKASLGKAKAGMKNVGGKISSKMRGGADSVKRFGQGTMHGMKSGMQGKKGFKKGTAQGRGQWTGNKLRQGYRGAKKLGGKGIEGIKKHGPTVARGLKKGALASLHHGVKAGRQIGGAIKSGWEAGAPKNRPNPPSVIKGPHGIFDPPTRKPPATAGAPAPAQGGGSKGPVGGSKGPVGGSKGPVGGSKGQGGGSKGQGGGGGNQTINFSPQIQQNQGGGGGGASQTQRGGSGGGGQSAQAPEKKLTGKALGKAQRAQKIALAGGHTKYRAKQILGGANKVKSGIARMAQGAMRTAQNTGGNA